MPGQVGGGFGAGGTGQPLDQDLTDLAALSGVRGDVIVRDASQWNRKAKGSIYQRLYMADANDPAYDYLPLQAIGGYWKNNPAATQTALVVAAMGAGGAVASYYTAPEAGVIVGLSWHFAGTHSAGTIQVRARLNGTGNSAVQTAVSGSSDLSGSILVAYGSGIAFSATHTLGVEMDTSAAWNGTAGALVCALFVIWNR